MINSRGVLTQLTQSHISVVVGDNSTKRLLVCLTQKERLKRQGKKYLGTISCGEDFGILLTLYQLQKTIIEAKSALSNCFLILEHGGRQSIAPLLLDMLFPKYVNSLGLEVIISTPTLDSFPSIQRETVGLILDVGPITEDEVKVLYERELSIV